VRGKRPNILIIDDELDTLKLLKIALERKGFKAFVAATWDEVLGHIKRIEGNNEKIDVIILDIMMPERSGFDLLIALKVILAPIPPVIMLSAVTGIEQQIRARELGAIKFITKPTTPSALVRVIRDVLSKP